MSDRRWRPVLTMLALAIPLLFALRWLAREFPKWYESSTITWVGDRTVRWSRSSAQLGSQVMMDEGEMLLDLETGRAQRLRLPEPIGNSGYGFYTTLNEVTIDGKVVWSTTEVVGGRGPNHLRVTDPHSMLTESFTMQEDDALFGGRYLMNQLPAAKYQVLDLQEPQPMRRSFTAITPYLYSEPIRNHSNFICVHPSYSEKPPLDAYVPPSWDAEVRELNARRKEQMGKDTDIGMLLLCRISSQGPQEIAHWPVYVPLTATRSTNVRADGPYIFCRSIDNHQLNIHEADTGKIITSIDLPQSQSDSNSPKPRKEVSWQANRLAITIEGVPVAYDPATGKPFPAEMGSKRILDRQGDHYLTLDRPTKSNTQPAKPLLQVWQAGTGKLLATHAHPAPPNPKFMQSDRELNQSIRLSKDGQQILVGTQNERVIFLDAITGQITRTVAVSPWRYPGIVIVLLMCGAWTVGWYRACKVAEVPQTFYALCVSAIVIAYMFMRCHLDGQTVYPGRPAVLCILALLIAWDVELVQFLVRPGTSMFLRLLCTGIFGVALLVSNLFFVQGFTTAVSFLFWSVINLSLVIVFIVQRAQGQLRPLNNSSGSNRRFGIKDIMLLTFVFALLASIPATTEWMVLFDVPELLAYIVAFAGIGLLAVLFRFWIVLRVGAIVVAGLVGWYTSQQPFMPTLETLWFACALVGPLGLFSCLWSANTRSQAEPGLCDT